MNFFIYIKTFLSDEKIGERYDFCFELKEIIFHLFSFVILKILVI
jgi:hypothetical protein